MSSGPNEKKSLKKKDCGSGSSHLNEDELADLDAFCAGFDCDEIGFDSWVDSNSCLNLVIERTISSCLAESPGSLVVKYTKRVQIDRDIKKIKTQITIEWQHITGSKKEFKFPSKGDQKDDEFGDLIITLIVCD